MKDDLLCLMKALSYVYVSFSAYVQTALAISHLQLILLTALLTMQSIVLQLMCYMQIH